MATQVSPQIAVANLPSIVFRGWYSAFQIPRHEEMAFAMADCETRSQMPKWAGHQDVYGLCSWVSVAKAAQLPWRWCLQHESGGASSALAALGQGFTALEPAAPHSLTPEGKTELSACRGSAPGPNCSRVPSQKAFIPSSLKDAGHYSLCRQS